MPWTLTGMRALSAFTTRPAAFSRLTASAKGLKALAWTLLKRGLSMTNDQRPGILQIDILLGHQRQSREFRHPDRAQEEQHAGDDQPEADDAGRRGQQQPRAAQEQGILHPAPPTRNSAGAV